MQDTTATRRPGSAPSRRTTRRPGERRSTTPARAGERDSSACPGEFRFRFSLRRGHGNALGPMAAKEIRPAPLDPIEPAEQPDEGHRHESRQDCVEVTTFECEAVEPAAKPFGG